MHSKTADQIFNSAEAQFSCLAMQVSRWIPAWSEKGVSGRDQYGSENLQKRQAVVRRAVILMH